MNRSNFDAAYVENFPMGLNLAAFESHKKSSWSSSQSHVQILVFRVEFCCWENSVHLNAQLTNSPTFINAVWSNEFEQLKARKITYPWEYYICSILIWFRISKWYKNYIRKNLCNSSVDIDFLFIAEWTFELKVTCFQGIHLRCHCMKIDLENRSIRDSVKNQWRKCWDQLFYEWNIWNLKFYLILSNRNIPTKFALYQARIIIFVFVYPFHWPDQLEKLIKIL